MPALGLGFITNVQYFAPTGQLLYGAQGEIRAVSFDASRGAIAGPAVSTLAGVMRPPAGGATCFSASHNGSLVYVPGGEDHELMWVDRHGTGVPAADQKGAYRFLRLSPDGLRIAVTIDAWPQDSQIWIIDTVRDTRVPITDSRHNLSPNWTPDGRRIAYYSNEELYWTLADGNGPAEALLTLPGDQGEPAWSPDGRHLAFLSTDRGSYDIHVLSLGEKRTVTPVVATPAAERLPRFSRDGRWLAYTSDESGREEVYVQPFPGPGPRTAVSTGGGTRPIWSADDRELFYRAGNRVVAADVKTHPTFTASRPRVLFEGPYVGASGDLSFDVSPDGKRFLMIRTDPSSSLTRFNLVLNWTPESTR